MFSTLPLSTVGGQNHSSSLGQPHSLTKVIRSQVKSRTQKRELYSMGPHWEEGQRLNRGPRKRQLSTANQGVAPPTAHPWAPICLSDGLRSCQSCEISFQRTSSPWFFSSSQRELSGKISFLQISFLRGPLLHQSRSDKDMRVS